MTERRERQDDHPGNDRRREPFDYERARFEYWRSVFAVSVAIIVILAVTFAAIFSKLSNEGVLIALVGASGAYLYGVSHSLSLDARRRKGDENGA